MTDRRLLERAVSAVQGLADAEPPWVEILESGRQLVGCDSATFLTFDGTGALTVYQDHLDPAALRDYVEHFHVLDVGLKTAMTCPSGTWINTDDLIPARVMEKTPYYADFMCRHRMRQIVSHIVRLDPVHRACFSFQREQVDRHAREQLEGPEITTFAHAMEDALARRRERAMDRIATMEDALGLYHEAVCVVSGSGTLCHASQRALEMFEGASMIRIRCGRLWHQSERVQQVIYAALQQAAVRQRMLTVVIPAERNGTVTMDMKRADPWMRLGNEALVSVRLRRSGNSDDMSLDVMQAVFDLSPAEGRVLHHLVAGLSAGEIASLVGVSLNTARKHIVMLMEKTGAKRQSDLIRMALQR